MIIDIQFEFPEAYIELGKVGVAEFVENGLMPLASNLFAEAIMAQITGRAATITDDDPVSVVLRVKDWKNIRDELWQDADAEAAQEATPATEAEWPACHETGPATSRCADKIDHALMRHGVIEP